MADFDYVVKRGVELRKWVDPPGPNGEPSRVRPHLGQEQLYRLGKVGTLIVIEAVVALVQAPPDSSLGGRLFAAYQAEGIAPQMLVSSPGLSSSIAWTPSYPGHYVVGIRRPQGGALLLPFDIEA